MTHYTPTEGQLLTAWLISSGADRMRGDHQERFKAEFYRFIAKVKADALREAADEYATSNREQTHGVTSVLMFMHHRADRIERDER